MLTRKPRVGDRVEFPDGQYRSGVVTDVGDDICWFAPDDARDPRYRSCFIWRFTDGFNTLATLVDAPSQETR